MAEVPPHLARMGVTHKDCAKCGEYKHYDCFCNDRRRRDGAHRECNDCKRAEIAPLRERYANYGRTHHRKRPWVNMIANARDRARRKGMAFDLDEHVEAIERRVMRGVCELSGVALSFDRERSPYSLSLDRKDSTGGYTYDNIRILAWGLNHALKDWGDDLMRPIMEGWING